MDPYVALFTTKIPHHSSHSGYEQLMNYVASNEVHARTRTNTQELVKLTTERLARRFAASRWYQWDGIQTEFKTLQLVKRQGNNLIAHFLYGDTAIGLLPYINPWLPGKIVLSIHACPADLPEVLQYPRLLKRVDHFILLGSNQKSFFMEHGVPENNLTVIPHGVDTSYFKPVENTEKLTENFDVLIVGNWRRNFELYQSVIADADEADKLHFHVVTADFNHHYFGESSQLTIHPKLSDLELLRMYQRADAMLLSVQDAVANNVLLESMSCGLPIVTEKNGALPEYLGEQYPLYFETGNAKDAYMKLRDLKSSDFDVREEIKNYLVDRAQTTYNWQKIAGKMHTFYNSLH